MTKAKPAEAAAPKPAKAKPAKAKPTKPVRINGKTFAAADLIVEDIPGKADRKLVKTKGDHAKLAALPQVKSKWTTEQVAAALAAVVCKR